MPDPTPGPLPPASAASRGGDAPDGRAQAALPVAAAITAWCASTKARAAGTDAPPPDAPVPDVALAADAPVPTASHDRTGHLMVDDLRIAAHPSGEVILDAIAFAVAPGQVLAISGPGGAGKSTLLQVLVGLRPAINGVIEVDGRPIAQWDAAHLGQRLGYLPQDAHLFAGTVRDNIASFCRSTDETQILAAARAAHAHEAILALEQGYDTDVGAFGVNLTAAQRRRVALARALFGAPPFVLLDAPGADLDDDGLAALTAALRDLRRSGRTVVLAAHRPEEIEAADLVLSLDRGRQIGFGPREDAAAPVTTSTAEPGDNAPNECCDEVAPAIARHEAG
jgi:ABC-type protease/lipase transport system fused ATPase/permease subunit